MSVFDFVTEPGSTNWNGRQTLCHRLSHRPWMPAAGERDVAVETGGTDAGGRQNQRQKLTLPRLRERASARQRLNLHMDSSTLQWAQEDPEA